MGGLEASSDLYTETLTLLEPALMASIIFRFVIEALNGGWSRVMSASSSTTLKVFQISSTFQADIDVQPCDIIGSRRPSVSVILPYR